MRKAHRGFTLVELLVVVGILAVLIGILLPALSKLQHQAKLTQCGANMRQILTSLNQFSAENRGRMLPVSGGYGMATNGGTPGVGPLFNRSHFQLDNGGQPGGLMSTASFVKVRLCPAASDVSLPSYSYNVHPAAAALVGGAIPTNWQNVVPRWTISTSHPRERILFMDVVRDVPSANHASGNRGVWNVGLPDGSIKPVSSNDVLAQLKIRPVTGGTGAAATTSWQRFNDYVRVLELLHAGRDPKLAMNGTRYYWDNPDNGTNQPNRYYFPHLPGAPLEPYEK